MAALCAQKAFRQAALSKSASRAPGSRSAVVVRATADRKLWAPTVDAPSYLNGELAGDYGERKPTFVIRTTARFPMYPTIINSASQVLTPWVWEPTQFA